MGRSAAHRRGCARPGCLVLAVEPKRVRGRAAGCTARRVPAGPERARRRSRAAAGRGARTSRRAAAAHRRRARASRARTARARGAAGQKNPLLEKHVERGGRRGKHKARGRAAAASTPSTHDTNAPPALTPTADAGPREPVSDVVPDEPDKLAPSSAEELAPTTPSSEPASVPQYENATPDVNDTAANGAPTP